MPLLRRLRRVIGERTAVVGIGLFPPELGIAPPVGLPPLSPPCLIQVAVTYGKSAPHFESAIGMQNSPMSFGLAHLHAMPRRGTLHFCVTSRLRQGKTCYARPDVAFEPVHLS